MAKGGQKKKRISERKGRIAEYITCAFLILRGFRIRALRYKPPFRHPVFGEIDIIAQRRHLIIFVEVKWRQSSTDDALESLSATQRRKITKTGRVFLEQQKEADLLYGRFDAIFFSGASWPLYIANAWGEET